MIITILCEPRTGSSNLLYWFNQNSNFSILLEPINNPNWHLYSTVSIKLHDKLNIQTWEWPSKHLVIKEICEPYKKYDNLLEFSDKIIILYRENSKEQIESWLMANNTNKWGKPYVYNKDLIINADYTFLTEIKNEIKKYKDNYFSISYEDLYYRNGIDKIISYLKIPELSNNKFPYGKKYRKKLSII